MPALQGSFPMQLLASSAIFATVLYLLVCSDAFLP